MLSTKDKVNCESRPLKFAKTKFPTYRNPINPYILKTRFCFSLSIRMYLQDYDSPYM